MPERLRKLLIKWTAAAVLFALAAFYTVLVFQYEYNLWGGPNFGMFATAEGPETRLVRCIVVSPERESVVPCPDQLGTDLIRVKGVPRHDTLDTVGRHFARVARADDLGPEHASGVRVELWQFRYDAESSHANFRQRLVTTVDFEGGDE